MLYQRMYFFNVQTICYGRMVNQFLMCEVWRQLYSYNVRRTRKMKVTLCCQWEQQRKFVTVKCFQNVPWYFFVRGCQIYHCLYWVYGTGIIRVLVLNCQHQTVQGQVINNSMLNSYHILNKTELHTTILHI